MKLYLAGAITGNLIRLWKEYMKIYLAGSYSRSYCLEEAMKIYLEGKEHWREEGLHDTAILKQHPYVLESFYYLQGDKHTWLMKMMPHFKGFLLDSGAFTYMNGAKGGADWDKYIEDYAGFINKWNIDNYFELDIDSIVGLDNVERLRNKLELLTNKQSIPVWHRNRGLDYWRKITKEYNYVAIGGIVTKEIKPKEYGIFKYLLKIAYQNKCKVHGLGFTNISGLKKYKFYSVDSTAWLYGNRGGFIYEFRNGEMLKHQQKGKRLSSKKSAIHNYNEWLKFQKYAETEL